MHKLREAMAAETADMKLANTVEIDGAYFGGHVRPANSREDRVDRRLLQNRTGKRRVVVVLRERGRTHFDARFPTRSRGRRLRQGAYRAGSCRRGG